MNKLKRYLLNLTAVALLSGTAAIAPVYARGTDSSGNNAGLKEVAAASASDTAIKTETQAEVENHTNALEEQFRSKAKSEISEKKSQTKSQTQANRQQSCEKRKAALRQRMQNAVAQAERHKNVIDKVYSRVQAFYVGKNLSVAEYPSLNLAASNAQASAVDAISALQKTDVSLDCTSSNVAESVSTFRAAVSQTRDSLKTYRTAVVSLISSLKGASSSGQSTNTNSNTDKTNSLSQ